MNITIAGGSGQIGRILSRHWSAKGHEITVVGRGTAAAPAGTRSVVWDGRELGEWAEALEDCDVVVNLAGRTVNCRYNEKNLREMMNSRVDSTRAVGRAIGKVNRPPALWLQMSTATIYAHRFDAANDEETGLIGGNEANVPALWKRSVDIGKAWEQALWQASTPDTRRVALRAAMVMSPDAGGVFDTLLGLVRRRLGGPIGGGAQFVSWVHENDFVAALDHLIASPAMDGAINICSPNPLPQRDFMRQLRQAAGVTMGLPATRWMTAIGAYFMRTETELVFKSRRVTPKRLLDSGFAFQFPLWADAAEELLARAAGAAKDQPRAA